MMHGRFGSLMRCLAFLLAWALGAAHGQSAVDRPVTLVVPWPAGGAADFVARVLGKSMAASLGQPVIVENLPGAGGSLGARKALSAPPDGHTLLLSSPLDLILAPLSFPSATYRPEDVRTLALLGRTDLLLVTRKDLGAASLAELVALMRARPEKPLSFCAMGSGSVQLLAGERLGATAGVKLMGVPYSGLGPCLNDLVTGLLDIAFVPVAGPFAALIDGGTVKALAVMGGSPNPRFPKLPPAQATPGFEGFSLSLWAGVHAHALVPQARAEHLSRAIADALTRPELRQAIENTGGVIYAPMTMAQAHDAYLREVSAFRAMAIAAGQPASPAAGR